MSLGDASGKENKSNVEYEQDGEEPISEFNPAVNTLDLARLRPERTVDAIGPLGTAEARFGEAYRAAREHYSDLKDEEEAPRRALVPSEKCSEVHLTTVVLPALRRGSTTLRRSVCGLR